MSTLLKDSATLHLFEAYGVELEYMIVDAQSLDVRALADQLFQRLTGQWTSLVPCGQLDMDNELAAHVVELKNPQPRKDLLSLKDLFQTKVQELGRDLQAMGCKLLPSAMHPWMDPYRELRLWPHGDATIYQTLHRIFDCRGHGWANLQSTHLNLPFCGDEEFHKLHSAIRLVLPLIPTLAASSPYADGKWTGVMDKRLLTYRDNAKKVFSVTGHVIPEVCRSIEEYYRTILEKIWKDLEPYDPEGILRYEWVNARGAIARFDRMAIEIRLIDIQEAPIMDLTIVQVIIELLQYLVQSGIWSKGDRWSCQSLKEILEQGIVKGEQAIFSTSWLELFGLHTRHEMTAQSFWRALTAEGIVQARDFSPTWQLILEEGTLASRLFKIAGENPSRKELHRLFERLTDCLNQGQPLLP